MVIPLLELAAQLDDLEIEADSRPVIRMRPRGSATPSTWGLIAAKALGKEWGVLAYELGHLVAGDRVIEAVGPDGPRSQRETSVHEDPWEGLRDAKVAWRYQVLPGIVAIQLKRAGPAPDSLINRACQMSANACSSVGGWEPKRQSLVAAAATRRVPPSLVKRAVQAWRKKLIPTATIDR